MSKLSNSRVAPSQVTKMSLRTPDPFLYTYVKVWAQDYSQMCYTVPGLCIRTVSSINLYLRHPKVKKAGSHQESNPGHLRLEPAVLGH